MKASDNECVDPVASVTDAAEAVLDELRRWDGLHGNMYEEDSTCGLRPS